MVDFKILKLSEEFYEAALKIFQENLLWDDNLGLTLLAVTDPTFNLNGRKISPELSSEFKRLHLNMLKKNDFNFVAVDSNSNEVLGFMVNHLCQVNPTETTTPESQEVYKTPTILALFEVVSQIEEIINPFEHFNAKCGIEMMAILTVEKARGRGIAKALFKRVLEAAREYPGCPKPAFLYGYYTSTISFAASRSAIGAEIFKVIPYSEITYKGQSLAEFAPPGAPPISIGGLKISI